jgi:hypothetical protein
MTLSQKHNINIQAKHDLAMLGAHVLRSSNYSLFTQQKPQDIDQYAIMSLDLAKKGWVCFTITYLRFKLKILCP